MEFVYSLSVSSAPRYPKILWYLWLLIIFRILPMNILGDFPPFAKQNATDFLQVDQQHLQLMDTFLQLFYLLWTWTADMKWIQLYVDICADGL